MIAKLKFASVEFASCYVYSPTGAGRLCERSRLLRQMLKEGNPRFLKNYARCLHAQIADSTRTADSTLPVGSTQLAGYLSPADVLVPVPGCAPKSDPNKCVASRLTEALLQQGLGGNSWNGLKRIRPVRKSSTAGALSRPSVALHYESFAIDQWFAIDAAVCAPANLVLVDDVITKGRTLLAAAARLREAFPAANIRAFALLRTMGLIPELRTLLEPCKGSIAWRYGDAWRHP